MIMSFLNMNYECGCFSLFQNITCSLLILTSVFFHVRESWLTALEWRKPSIYNSKAALFLAPRPCHMFTTNNQSHIKQSATNPVTIGVMDNNFLGGFFLTKTYYGIVALTTYLIKENGVGWLLMSLNKDRIDFSKSKSKHLKGRLRLSVR